METGKVFKTKEVERGKEAKGECSNEWLYILLMQRSAPTQSGIGRWDGYEGMPVSGSLIIGQSTGSPKHYNSNAKLKFDELGFKQNLFVRHDSEKQLTKNDFHKTPPFLQAP